MRHSMISLLLVAQTYYIPVKFPRKEREKLKKKSTPADTEMLSFILSLLSDSNQRPRDYKSRDSKGAGRIGLTRFAVAKVHLFL